MMPLVAGVPTPKVRVFVADNAEVIVQTLAAVLELAGYDACALYDGNAAVRLLDLLRPDLVITDVTTPGILEVQCSFSTHLPLPRCKILLFTSYGDLHSLLREEHAESLPFELLTSPIRAAELLEKLGRGLCSEHPPLLVPLDISDATIH